MRSLLLGTLTMLLFFSPLLGKEKPKPYYPAALIDSTLKKDAWAVCREYSDEFILRDNGRATEKVHVVITVLDKRGDNLAELQLSYDKTSRITSISGRNYDAAGMYDERLKNKAIQDVNLTSEGTLYDDLRMKIAKIDTNNYPYTVEYEYEFSYDGLLGYPQWQPLEGYHLSVEKSSFAFSYPENMEIRYREQNIPAGFRSEKQDKGIRTLEWKIASLPAQKEEPYSPSLSAGTPLVITAPVNFDYCGTSGNMKTWNDFGLWIGKLLENRGQLPASRQQEIKELVKGMKDTTQIVSTLYGYMQKRTRYVGIQLGIGGYQPFPAETVDKLGYGDCKALSNYMRSLLSIAGIRSNYTVAGASHSRGITMTDFPTASQCNHVILCVPLKKDTIWLECTNQTEPFGYLGKFTAGRMALMIDATGGHIAATPLLTAQQSSQVRVANVTVDATGAIEAKTKAEYSGYQFEAIAGILTEGKKEQEKALYENLAVKGMAIADFSYLKQPDRLPKATETVSLSSRMAVTRSGSRIFIPVNLFNQIATIPSRVENRKMPVYREFGFLDSDSVVFHLPKGFKPESIPADKSLTTPFGSYSSTLKVHDDQAVYTRRFTLIRGTWPKEQYSALVDFYTSVISFDKMKLVIREETP